MTIAWPKTARILALLAVLAVGFGFRWYSIRFGLPSSYDPDELFFAVKSLEMLRDGTFNPAWFGHPGTVTIYTLALTNIAVLFGGGYADPAAFSAAIFAEPATVIWPARVMIMLWGMAGIGLCYHLGMRLNGPSTGLGAAAILALSPLHIEMSQLVRTDAQVTVFVLLTLICAARISERNRLRDYMFAALCLALATATKWPGAIAIFGVIGAALHYALGNRHHAVATVRKLMLFFAAAPVFLILISPYLLLDFSTVMANIGGEAKSLHPGAEGEGFWRNLLWYATPVLRYEVGVFGLALVLIGLGTAMAAKSRAVLILVPVIGLFCILIAGHPLRWARWLLPLMPLFAILAAIGLQALARWLSNWPVALPMAPLALGLWAIVLTPIAGAAIASGHERNNDTRDLAVEWIAANAEPGSMITFEYFAFALLPEPLGFLFPTGPAGCVDARKALRGEIRMDEVEGGRDAQPVISVGTTDQDALSTCAADYAVITQYDRYPVDDPAYASVRATYAVYFARGEEVARFDPSPGQVGGPVVRVYRFHDDGE